MIYVVNQLYLNIYGVYALLCSGEICVCQVWDKIFCLETISSTKRYNCQMEDEQHWLRVIIDQQHPGRAIPASWHLGRDFSGGEIHCLRRLNREGAPERFSRSWQLVHRSVAPASGGNGAPRMRSSAKPLQNLYHTNLEKVH